ncbi:LCP family protein [Cohnella sp. REN36]|uniref:LCP family glycopolymer transferase n=1 Tax=Cohnella sp. REN36 TaxID=2887347 RepID=UPI001D158F98|nr:LCP family protein [Cohnella sp. REN36]MCC3376011.1 LCP family protein [Cohnella sp. REN36]
MKKWIWIGVSITGFLVLVAGGLLIYAYYSLQHTAKQVYEPLDRPHYVSRDTEIKTEKISTSAMSSFTVMMLGVDERENDRGRSDTIILLTVNPSTEKVLMFNIPRDTRTEIVGRDTEDKINHAYAFDGLAGSIRTVEHFLDMPIDYYVEVNMEGFETVVDTLNGVDVNNPFAFDYSGTSFPKGPLHLNGADALKFSRMRYDDPRGDFGRNERQRQIVKDVIRRAAQWNNAFDLPQLLKDVGKTVKTNLTFDEMQDLILKYRKHIKTVDTTEIRGQGKMIGGIYYYLVDQQERDRIHAAMKQTLQGS